MAEAVSKSTVQRWFALFGIKPHSSDTFKLSSDPFFVEKVRHGPDPPDHAVVLCVDEKSQALQPTLPMGYVEDYTHDYGTTTLFAALDVATGDAPSGIDTRSFSPSCG